jgi:hypothetical protein
MMEQGKQMRFTEEEIKLLESTFKGNERLVKLMRKVFLPEYDPNAPLSQVVDLWMTLDLQNVSPQDAMVRIWARNSLITHVEQQLMQINFLANMGQETEEEKTKRIKADSAK